jgi:hypothetical protein
LSILAIKQCLQRRSLLRKIENLNEIEEALEFDRATVPNRILSKQQQQQQQQTTLNRDNNNIINNNNLSITNDDNTPTKIINEEINKKNINYNPYHHSNYNTNPRSTKNNYTEQSNYQQNQQQQHHFDDYELDNFENFKLITKNGSTKIVNGINDNISEYEIPIIRYNDRIMQQYTNY